MGVVYAVKGINTIHAFYGINTQYAFSGIPDVHARRIEYPWGGAILDGVNYWVVVRASGRMESQPRLRFRKKMPAFHVAANIPTMSFLDTHTESAVRDFLARIPADIRLDRAILFGKRAASTPQIVMRMLP
jgi:hypothetical protein